MAEKNIIMQRKKSDGTYDKYYPKTKAGLVEFADGTTVEAHKAEIATQNTAGHIKLSDIPIYTHPTHAGWKHIPSGGSPGQFLAYGGSSGVAKWEDIMTTRYLIDEDFNKYVDFSTGYIKKGESYSNLEVRTDSIPMEINSEPSYDGDVGTIVTANTIDLTDYNSLSVTLKHDSPYGRSSAYVVISTNKDANYTTYNKRVYQGSMQSNGIYVLSIPINDINGYYYIRVHAIGSGESYNGASGLKTQILEMKLLK